MLYTTFNRHGSPFFERFSWRKLFQRAERSERVERVERWNDTLGLLCMQIVKTVLLEAPSLVIG